MTKQNVIRILTIDDEAAIRTSISNYLEDLNYQIFEASDGQDGLEKFFKLKPDLVLVDLRMPNISGQDVLGAIRQASPETALIVISGTGAISDAIGAVQNGAWDYILKPIQDMKVLRHAVEKALERQRLLQEKKAHQIHLERLVLERTDDLRLAYVELQVVNQKLGQVVRAARGLSSFSDPSELARELLEEFMSLVKATRGCVFLAGPDGLHGLRAIGLLGKGVSAYSDADLQQLHANLTSDGRPSWVVDGILKTGGERGVSVRVMPGFERGSSLLFALEDQKGRVGAVLLGHDSVDGFSSHDVDVGALLASHGCKALRATQAETERRKLEEKLRQHLEQQNEYLLQEIQASNAYGDIIGKSAEIQVVIEQIESVAPTDASALILGETGTGKELIARAIHERSRRKGKPFIKVSCGAIPRELFESEFFGHVRGAFTGAIKDRLGRFQLADGGTLFLDEIGELPLELQSKLLRVLQEGTFERVGDDRTRKVDVRIIAATHRNLNDPKVFREDLYYRIGVFPIWVPALRERATDVILLTEQFIASAGRRFKVPVNKLGAKNEATLLSYSWPGNVRELQNVVERAVILANGGPLEFGMLKASTSFVVDSSARVQEREPTEAVLLTDEEMKEQQRERIELALVSCGGKIYGIGGAAEKLGLKPTTLVSRIKRMGITRP